MWEQPGVDLEIIEPGANVMNYQSQLDAPHFPTDASPINSRLTTLYQRQRRDEAK